MSPNLLAYRRYIGKRLALYWKNRSISAHPAIREYHRLHELFGVIDEPPAPERLIMYVRRNQDFTSSGAIVDCYNIVSGKTLLSIGAHDVAKLHTPITLRQCTHDDIFVPLSHTEACRVTGEYGYVDPQKRVICRLDVLQGEYSKTTRDSRDIIFFLQGNACLSSTALLKGTWLLAEIIERFTGGQSELVDFLDVAGTRTVSSHRPHVTLDDFKELDLRKGTAVRVEPLVGMPALSVVTVDAGTEVQALTTTANVSADVVGQQVIIASGLHPLTIGRKQFRAYLITVNANAAACVLTVDSDIPDGVKLY
jgi:DNA/RNA-binding domain of Phe-tRNA-synthetase-like protein